MILIYLIKSTLCLGILFGFYKIALESKAMHQFKRFYLLASLIFACAIPLITFSYETETPLEQPVGTIFSGLTEAVYQGNTAQTIPEVDYTHTILWSLYGLGFLIFGARFVLNLVRLKRKIDTSETVSEKDFTLALLGKTLVPHSFFRWIFLNKIEYLNQEIAPEVLAHEATHVRQKHSWDILFIEMLQVVFWFNPLIWLSKRSIKLNHEFLADQGAVNNKSNIAIYQNILLSYASSTHHTALESPFNYSLTKKRIVMLSQSFSRKKLLARALLLIPIIGLCVLFFNQGIVAQARTPYEITKNKEQMVQSLQEKTYATQFIEGAQRNDKNAIVIEVKNDSIYINGKYTPVGQLRKAIDAATANWTKEEYADPMRSVIFKGNSQEFIQRAQKEFQKTKLYKANTSLRLIPPPPPAPGTPNVPGPPPPPSSPIKHLEKMKSLGGLFFNETKNVSFDQAVTLVASNKNLNVQTPYPYSNPPKTYISKEPAHILKKSTGSAGLATKKELETYNRLAKKYNASPQGVIKVKEVTLMYAIYAKMNAQQKKKAEVYPALPPPPPPAPRKVIKGKNDGDKNNPPPPPLPKKSNQRASIHQGQDSEDKNYAVNRDRNSKKMGYSFSSDSLSSSSLSIFSKIKEYPNNVPSQEVSGSLNFQPSSVQAVSHSLSSNDASKVVLDSIIKINNIDAKDVVIKRENIKVKENTVKNYELGSYSVGTGLKKNEAADYHATMRAVVPVSKNSKG